MDLAALEYPAIVERLAAATATPHGKELARALAPSGDEAEVALRQALTAEAVGLCDRSEEPELAGLADVREAAARAARGGSLAAPVLRAIAGSIAIGLRARAVLDGGPPLLAALAAEIDPGLAALGAELDRAVADDGADLRDTASPALRRLRRELRRSALQVTEELRRLARAPALRAHLQEEFVAERSGRPVLAVQAAARRRVPGIVHDVSDSGRTLFVEPLEVVELANRQAEAAAAEREEVEQLLAELSRAAGARSAELAALVEAAGAIDLALACAALSRGWGGAPVVAGDGVRLLGARHPLLDRSRAVPIDLDLGSVRAVVVSGPNTGGKTVALKTVGLAALLHQAGLRPPAREAELPVFDDVLADIGDAQSIEMSLSTFSGHVENLVRILAGASGRSLVLLDEVLGGTDPVEGSALAQALVARLGARARLTVVTTHYPELKEWAAAAPGALNAATALEPETGEPLYRVALGRPGISHALRTAERLGLDSGVVADARALVAPERLRIADLLARTEEAERAAAADRERAARAAAALTEREAALGAELDRARAARASGRADARAEAEQELAATRAALAAARDELRAARRAAQATAGKEADRRLGAATERTREAARALESVAEPVELDVTAPLAVGDPVEAPAVGLRGTVVAVEGDAAVVAGSSGQRVRIAVARLRPSRTRDAAAGPPVRVRASARSDVPDELDVRGLRADEAREAVRRVVDAAALAGAAEVRVVHGRGTGALRTAVRDELERHPLVEASAVDAAGGATTARLGA